jgi:hypothetical protein
VNLTKPDWYTILLAIVIIALVGANELGLGVLAFAPLILLAYWLMVKAFE